MKNFYDSPLLETRSEGAFDYIRNMLIYIISISFFGNFWGLLIALAIIIKIGLK